MPVQFYEQDFDPVTLSNPYWAERAINCFQKENKHGSLAIIRKDKHAGAMMISGRGHKGVPTIFSVSDIKDSKSEIIASGKASANTPLIFHFMKEHNYDVSLHEHKFLPKAETYGYEFPGTKEETNYYKSSSFNIEHHGYITGYKLVPTNWDKYYELYPDRFFKVPELISRVLSEEKGTDILDIGCNNRPVKRATHVLEPNVVVTGYEDTNLSWDKLNEMPSKFNLIVMNNSFNYLNEIELSIAIRALKKGGKIIANSFSPLLESKMIDDGIAILGNKGGSFGETILHLLFLENGICMEHSFYNTNIEFIKKFKFNITFYKANSLYFEYVKN